FFFFSSSRRHTRFSRDWSSDVCSSDLRKKDRNYLLPLRLFELFFLLLACVSTLGPTFLPRLWRCAFCCFFSSSAAFTSAIVSVGLKSGRVLASSLSPINFSISFK